MSSDYKWAVAGVLVAATVGTAVNMMISPRRPGVVHYRGAKFKIYHVPVGYQVYIWSAEDGEWAVLDGYWKSATRADEEARAAIDFSLQT